MKKTILFILFVLPIKIYSQTPYGVYCSSSGRQCISIYNDTLLCLSYMTNEKTKGHKCLVQRNCYIGNYHREGNFIYSGKNRYYDYALSIDSMCINLDTIVIEVLCDDYDEQFLFTLSKNGQKHKDIIIYNKNYCTVLISNSKRINIFKPTKHRDVYKRKEIKSGIVNSFIGSPVILKVQSFDLNIITPILLQWGKKYTIRYKYPVEMAKGAMPDIFTIEYINTEDALILKSDNYEDIFLKKANTIYTDIDEQLLFMLRKINTQPIAADL